MEGQANNRVISCNNRYCAATLGVVVSASPNLEEAFKPRRSCRGLTFNLQEACPRMRKFA